MMPGRSRKRPGIHPCRCASRARASGWRPPALQRNPALLDRSRTALDRSRRKARQRGERRVATFRAGGDAGAGRQALLIPSWKPAKHAASRGLALRIGHCAAVTQADVETCANRRGRGRDAAETGGNRWERRAQHAAAGRRTARATAVSSLPGLCGAAVGTSHRGGDRSLEHVAALAAVNGLVLWRTHFGAAPCD